VRADQQPEDRHHLFRVEHEQEAEGDRRGPADHPSRGRPRSLDQPPSQPRDRVLGPHGVERRCCAGNHEAAERHQQRPDEQVAEERVEDPADRGLDLLVGELVRALDAGDEAGADHDQDDRERGSRGRDRDRRAQDPGAAVRRGDDRGDQRQDGEQRRDDPEQADVAGYGESLLREVLAAELRQLDLDVLRDLVGELGLHRAQREAHDLDAVGEVDRDVALVAHEQQPVGLLGRLGEDRAKLPGLDHGVDDRLE
jgi:hypothetical protein